MQQTFEMKTNFRIDQTNFKWEIQDWDKLYQRIGGIRSRDFTLKGLDAKIYFTFYLAHSDLEFNVIVVYSGLLVRPDVNAYVLEVGNIKASMTQVLKSAEKVNMYRYRFRLPKVCLDEYKIQNLYVINNILTIYCDVKYYEYITTVKELNELPRKGLITLPEEKSVQAKETVFTDESVSSDEDANESCDDDLDKPENQFHGKYSFRDYIKFFEESRLCDVVFVFKLGEVKAHRAILVRKCPYFRYKLTTEHANESEVYRIDCTGYKNLSPSILRCFLEYLYGIKTFHDLRRSIGVTQLYILAKEYKMNRLKMVCKRYMRKKCA